ncbi:MAG: nucleoid-associated protein, YbaB/EbfC family [Legionellales bacterium]|nr:nucleoid-associated protein, YbaB/EbfC family [Legionellales bacterium]HAG62191.1 nucleoid-associated protein, YbaB/EbfC family [Coxiellaceae bacterium]|tara:strand:- start:175 stop:504 length:330 start_codon:yes stop_codon:yes gene_type:complete
MFGDKMNIMSLLKNAKNIEKMMSQAQEELEKIEITGEAGAGAVTVVMNAKHTIKSIHVDDEIYNESKEVTLELIQGALNHASQQVAEIAQSKMMNPGDLFNSMSDGDDK